LVLPQCVIALPPLNRGYIGIVFLATKLNPKGGKQMSEEIYNSRRHLLIYFHEVDKGGHFATWEQPELFSAEIRVAFRSLR
jgi:pimeloyl-ACP methyl ester carboxylesterase